MAGSSAVYLSASTFRLGDSLIDLPRTLEAALTPEWLSDMLPPEASRPRIVGVEELARVQDLSFKPKIVRFMVHYEDGSSAPLCLKAVLRDAASRASDRTSVREAKFFSLVAPHLPIRLPPVLAAPIDEARGVGFLLMRDMVADGARFLSALEPWDVAWVSSILDQMARLHAVHNVLGPIDNLDWVSRSLEWLTKYASVETIQRLLDGPRSAGLPGRTRDASLVVDGLRAFASIDQGRTPCLIHGDAHASNIFADAGGPGLMDWQMLQKGSWALDVAYHISAVLPVEVAEREERVLFEYYLERAREYGAITPDGEAAWIEYRQSLVYGHFLASITQTFYAALINEMSKRLAHAVERHDTYRLLGLGGSSPDSLTLERRLAITTDPPAGWPSSLTSGHGQGGERSPTAALCNTPEGPSLCPAGRFVRQPCRAAPAGPPRRRACLSAGSGRGASHAAFRGAPVHAGLAVGDHPAAVFLAEGVRVVAAVVWADVGVDRIVGPRGRRVRPGQFDLTGRDVVPHEGGGLPLRRVCGASEAAHPLADGLSAFVATAGGFEDPVDRELACELIDPQAVSGHVVIGQDAPDLLAR